MNSASASAGVDPRLEDLLARDVVLRLPGMDRVSVRTDLTYKRVGNLDLCFDLYSPSGTDTVHPAVIFINGDGPSEVLSRAKDWGQYTSWGRLAAASGMIGVTFNHRSSERLARLRDAASDITDLLVHILTHGMELGIDTRWLCVWLCSGAGPLALPELIANPPEAVRCIVVYYARVDLRHLRDQVASVVDDDTLRAFSPVVHLERARRLPPVLIARAGRDRPEINEGLDRFVGIALARNLPVEVINHPEGEHGFDTRNAVPASREIIRRTLEFMRAHLADASS